MKRKVTIIKDKKENEMKKITALIFALILTLGLVGCNGKTVNIDFPFEVEDVESVEMYHYDGVPASAEKKVVVAESDIKTLYDMFKGLSLKDKTAEETAGADVTSFRFNLSDGSSYDLIYACDGVKNGKLKSEAGDFEYFTSADIGSYWNNLNRELENIGDYSVSFDKNMIAQIVLNGEDYAFETEAVTLEPGEAYSVDISIPYPVARQNGTNNVKITATTGDTTATYKESFTH